MQLKKNINHLISKSTRPLVLSFVFILFVSTPLFASVTFIWSGFPIEGERIDYFPSGEAVFAVSGDILTLTLTNTTAHQTQALGELLSALTWDITGSGIALTPISAMVASGSTLFPAWSPNYTDLSGEWAFKDDILAGALGSYGVSSVGDILDGIDSFGEADRFDTSAGANLFGPASPNGVNASIINHNIASNFPPPGVGTPKPYVQNQMIFTFSFTGDLSENMITNVTPLFGSDGMPTVVPEPATLLSIGLGLLGLGALGRKKRRS